MLVRLFADFVCFALLCLRIRLVGVLFGHMLSFFVSIPETATLCSVLFAALRAIYEAWSESADRTLSAENKPRPHHAADGLVHNRLTGNVSPDGAEMLRWRSTDRVES